MRKDSDATQTRARTRSRIHRPLSRSHSTRIKELDILREAISAKLLHRIKWNLILLSVLRCFTPVRFLLWFDEISLTNPWRWHFSANLITLLDSTWNLLSILQKTFYDQRFSLISHYWIFCIGVSISLISFFLFPTFSVHWISTDLVLAINRQLFPHTDLASCLFKSSVHPFAPRVMFPLLPPSFPHFPLFPLASTSFFHFHPISFTSTLFPWLPPNFLYFHPLSFISILVAWVTVFSWSTRLASLFFPVPSMGPLAFPVIFSVIKCVIFYIVP